MLNNERLAVAAHLHILLRRKLGRVTDVEWMAQNDVYAHEIVRLALAEGDQPELLALAYRLRALLPSAVALGCPAPAAVRRDATATPRYVRSLR